MVNLEVKNLTKIYDKKKVLNDISFSVNEGEFLSILGVFAKKVIIDLSRCEIGNIYSVIVNPIGNITLVEN